MTEVLAIIPARGGSKGIPRKNIRNFAGYPLLAYSIAAGLQAKSVTRVIVSTDDEEIAVVAREFGAGTPFMRPVEFAQDDTTDLPVFQHALAWLAEHEGYKPEVVVQLRPTSPIRPRDCVDSAVNTLLAHPDADSVRGVVPAGQNPHKMWRISGRDGRMTPLLAVAGITEPYNAPSPKPAADLLADRPGGCDPAEHDLAESLDERRQSVSARDRFPLFSGYRQPGGLGQV